MENEKANPGVRKKRRLRMRIGKINPNLKRKRMIQEREKLSVNEMGVGKREKK